MHTSMSFSSGILMASDTPHHDPDFSAGTNFSLSIETENRAQTEEWLEKLASDGGEVTMEAQEMFWGAYFGMCTDRYGISWMLLCDH